MRGSFQPGSLVRTGVVQVASEGSEDDTDNRSSLVGNADTDTASSDTSGEVCRPIDRVHDPVWLAAQFRLFTCREALLADESVKGSNISGTFGTLIAMYRLPTYDRDTLR